MPLQKLQFRPGLNREGTDYSNEGGWYDGDKIRFRSGFPEKIGGWARLSSNTFLGVCRDLWNWVDLAGNNYVGVGTNLKYYIEAGGNYNDITPFTVIHTLTNPLSTVSGSATLTITDSTYQPNIGDYIVISGATSFNGVTATTLNKEWVIASITSNTTFTVTLPYTASGTGSGGGSACVISYELPVGNNSYTTGNGWGAGSWSPTIPQTLTNPFSTTSGSGTVTVTQTGHGYLTTAGSFIVGQQYKIVSVGTTDFTAIGASANTVGTLFTASGVGAGTGTASIGWVAFRDITVTVGGIPTALMNNTFQITYVDANTYTIKTNGNTGTFLATSTTSGVGGSVTLYPQYGARGWSQAAATSSVGQQLRLWTSDNYGQDLVLAPRGSGIFYWQDANGVGTRAQLLSTLATFKGYLGQYVPNQTNQVLSSAIQRFVIAMGANSYQSGLSTTPFNPMLVRWSDQQNPYQWVPDITNQSGEFTLTNGSYIVGARATRQEILIWTDSALYSMQYLGAPYVWGFQILMDNISVISPNAVVTVNNVTYWMGQEKFYMYSGRVETLPCSLRQFIFDDINPAQNFQVFAGANEGYNEVWWYYVSNDSVDGLPDKYVIYNYLDRVWYYGTMARSAWLGSGIQTYPLAANYLNSASFKGYISGYTLYVTNISSGSISLDTTISGSGVTAGTTIVSYGTGNGGTGTYNLSTAQTVGTITAPTTMAAAGGFGYLLQHENGVDDNAGLTTRPINSYVQSSDFDIGDGHNFGFVWRILPDVNFNGSTTNQPSVTMTVKPRENSGTPYGTADNPAVTSTQNYTNTRVYNVQQFDGQVYTRLRGRQMSFRIESGGQTGVTWQLGSPRIDIRPDGRR